jgi:hypothetical protein
MPRITLAEEVKMYDRRAVRRKRVRALRKKLLELARAGKLKGLKHEDK